MILCIDIGNTTFTYAGYENNELIFKNRFLTKKHMIKVAIANIAEKTDAVMVSSVVPKLNPVLKKQVYGKFGFLPVFVESSFDLGITVDIKPQKSLGSDLFVGAVAACHKYGAPHIVVDMGTAITLFLTTADKHFKGGMICPGMKVSFQNLLARASLLKGCEENHPSSVIGTTTEECIGSGMFYGISSLIKGSVSMMLKEAGISSAKIILTGGDAGEVYRYLPGYILDQTLILDGLNLIYQKMKENKNV